MPTAPAPSFVMKAGDTKPIRLTVTDDDQTPAVPRDLSSIQNILWEVAPYRPGRTAPVLTKSLGQGVTVVDAAGGVIEIQIDAADSEDWSGTMSHETKVVDGFGNVTTVYYTSGASTWFYGLFVVEPQRIE